MGPGMVFDLCQQKEFLLSDCEKFAESQEMCGKSGLGARLGLPERWLQGY